MNDSEGYVVGYSVRYCLEHAPADVLEKIPITVGEAAVAPLDVECSVCGVSIQKVAQYFTRRS